MLVNTMKKYIPLAALGFAYAVAAAEYTPLYLRAMSYKYAIPSFNGYLDIDDSGVVGLNRTAQGTSYPGFESYINSLPTNDKPLVSGQLFQSETDRDDVPACLVPTTGDVSGLYDFVFQAGCSEVQGALYTDFYWKVVECGGNCGGLGVGYNLTVDTASGISNTWVVYNASTTEYEYGKKIRFYSGATIPTDHYPAYLWRS